MNSTLQAATDAIKLPAIRRPIPAKTIDYLEGYGNYTRVFVHGQPTPVIATRTLKWFEEQLPGFIRLHKSMLVNQQFIKGIAQYSARDRSMWLLLKNNAIVKVSRRRADAVLGQLDLLAN